MGALEDVMKMQIAITGAGKQLIVHPSDYAVMTRDEKTPPGVALIQSETVSPGRCVLIDDTPPEAPPTLICPEMEPQRKRRNKATKKKYVYKKRRK